MNIFLLEALSKNEELKVLSFSSLGVGATGFTPGNAPETIWYVRDRTLLTSMQGKYLALCAIFLTLCDLSYTAFVLTSPHALFNSEAISSALYLREKVGQAGEYL